MNCPRKRFAEAQKLGGNHPPLCKPAKIGEKMIEFEHRAIPNGLPYSVIGTVLIQVLDEDVRPFESNCHRSEKLVRGPRDQLSCMVRKSVRDVCSALAQ